jgi:hypothetical protein
MQPRRFVMMGINLDSYNAIVWGYFHILSTFEQLVA